MRTPCVALALIATALAHAVGHAQAPAQGPTFDVVSIRPNVPQGDQRAFPGMLQQLNGSLTMTRVTARLILSAAYPLANNMEGLPDWASRDLFDINATSTLTTTTADDRLTMMRAMLADRFHLLAHMERRDVPTFDLVLARADGRLGPGLTRPDLDCDVVAKARQAEAAEALKRGTVIPPPSFDPNTRPVCSSFLTPTGIVGDMTMDRLASLLRPASGRPVVNKTGLTGIYRMNLMFTRNPASDAPPVAPPPADDALSVFTAVRELGLKLEPSRAERDVLVVDRLESPTEN